ncbi:MAG: hypothetical protein AAF078_12795, partial [Planctomycetota bacterium]
ERPSRGPEHKRLNKLGEAIAIKAIETRPDEVVVEIPGNHPPAKLGPAVRGQAKYGMAVGAVSMAVYWWLSQLKVSEPQVFGVEVNVWTRRRSKGKRADLLGLISPAAKAKIASVGKDPGLDMHDAVELGMWWLDGGRLEHVTRSKA